MDESTLLTDDKLEKIAETEENTVEIEETVVDNEIQTEEKNVDNMEEQEKISLNEVAISLDTLSKQIDDMNKLFVQKIQHTTHEEKIVDQMHSELQKYKDDMYSQLVRPILLDIIEVRDSILRMTKNYASKLEGEQNIPLKIFSDYAFEVQDILEKNSISIYECSEGDVFVPIKQRAVKKIETTVAELHGKVAESLSPGYDYMGKTISPEKVAVYLYKEPDELKGENE